MTFEFDDRNEPISERHVQALWYDERLRPKELRTVRGASVSVLDPGVWNLESGPDFRDAVLALGPEQTRVRGDVEIHLRPSDWTAHHHARDPAYAHVIAHVTWRPGPIVFSKEDGLPNGCVSICLGDFLRARPDFSPDEIDLTAYPFACPPATPRPCEALFDQRPDWAQAVLCAAGRHRLAVKARRLKTRLVRTPDRAQVFYEEVMAALGFKYNAMSFRTLAKVLPWKDLPNEWETAQESLTCAAEMGLPSAAPWRTANVRPNNTPKKRIRTAAMLLAPTDADGVTPRLLGESMRQDLAARAGQKMMMARLCEPGVLGFRRAAALMANVIIPFALAEGRLSEPPSWLYPEDLCAPVRLTAFRLFGRDHNPALYMGNGILIQGLLQIHRIFCLSTHPACSDCAFVKLLKQRH